MVSMHILLVLYSLLLVLLSEMSIPFTAVSQRTADGYTLINLRNRQFLIIRSEDGKANAS